MTVSPTPWLLRAPRPRSAVRVFCLPVSGIGASAFRQWPSQRGPVEFCPVQLPGRENRMREPLVTDMAALAHDAVDALEPWLGEPYAFFGHCLGGRISYAMTVEALGRGLRPPASLLVSSCLAPHHGGRFGPYLPEMPDEEYLSHLGRAAQAQGYPPPEPELGAIAVRILRADVALSCGYVPDGPGAVPLDVVTIGWTDDQDVAPDEMADWSSYGSVSSVVLPGDAFTFMCAPDALMSTVAAAVGPRADVGRCGSGEESRRTVITA